MHTPNRSFNETKNTKVEKNQATLGFTVKLLLQGKRKHKIRSRCRYLRHIEIFLHHSSTVRRPGKHPHMRRNRCKYPDLHLLAFFIPPFNYVHYTHIAYRLQVFFPLLLPKERALISTIFLHCKSVCGIYN